MRRRDLIRTIPAAALAQTAAVSQDSNTITIDPTPQFEISPWLYMQFMEPLGSTDASVEAVWDYDADDWRKDFVDVVRDLGPNVMRFGGLFSRYYKWREGVGPVGKRPLVRNYVWGAKETNRVGTHEFVSFCRRVGAEPMYCVNFLGDGDPRYTKTREGDRTGDAQEAADWVSYANDPDNAERRRNGSAEAFGIRLWQVGNETSYGPNTFSRDESIRHTVEFSKAMKGRDKSIRIIGWGDRGRNGPLWAPELLKQAGEHIDLVALHMMGQSPRRKDTVLKGLRYQQEPEQAWQELLELSNNIDKRLTEFEQSIAGVAPHVGIAITEGHLSLSPHNTNPFLAEWLSAAYHARSFNIYQRHGARLKIATAADFQGNRWTVTCVMNPTPRGNSFLMPVGSIARLFRRYNGTHGVAVRGVPSGLDIAASRKGNQLFLHIANLEYSRPVTAKVAVDGMTIAAGNVHMIAPANLREYVNQDQPDVFRPVTRSLTAGAPNLTFPPGSVMAVELTCS